MPSRQPHDPLRGISWQQGVAPQPEPTETQPEPFEQAPDVHGVSWRCQMRAVSTIRRLYGLQSPFDWSRRANFYDKQARKVYEMLMRGEAIPDRYRCHHREPEPIDPSSWGPSGYW
jgi:hypothetical protein